MSEESKKKQQKGRCDAKDQRKPRNRHQAENLDKKNARKSKDHTGPDLQKTVDEDPGHEFYKNLKRETDEILNITEEANSKYQKKEIQSNWSKYEMPIETYDEIDEQENMGADYEKLIEASLSVGGHFQFKHEKSWEVDTAPSLYDKYFEVNMDSLFVAVSTIPFYKRLNVNQTVFSETDMLNMNNRSTRFKQKFYNNKKFTTPELTMQNHILNSYTESKEAKDSIDDVSIDLIEKHGKKVSTNEILLEKNPEIKMYEMQLEYTKNSEQNTEGSLPYNSKKYEHEPNLQKEVQDLDNFEDLIFKSQDLKTQELKEKEIELSVLDDITKDTNVDKSKTEPEHEKPVIESPEDLEKWLNDFLDE